MSNDSLERSIARVREILGPKLEEIVVTRAAFGLFFSGVKLSTGHGGLCFTPVKELPEAVCCPSSAKAMPLSGKLAGRGATECLEDIFGANILKKTLGIAALNALSTLCMELSPAPYRTAAGDAVEILHNEDAFDVLELMPGGNHVVVGALVPMLKRLIRRELDFTVLEMDSRTLKGKELEHFRPAGDAPLVVPDADVLVITGTTILNGTLDNLLALAKPGCRILVTGPTASMLPDAFLERGVTMLGGIAVTKPDAALDIIGEAGSGYHMFGKCAERLVIRKAV